MVLDLSDKEWQILEPLMPELPTDRKGRPVSVLMLSASCHEVRWGEPALDACWNSATLAVLIGDKAYTQIL